jgi:hypothetical protein
VETVTFPIMRTHSESLSSELGGESVRKMSHFALFAPPAGADSVARFGVARMFEAGDPQSHHLGPPICFTRVLSPAAGAALRARSARCARAAREPYPSYRLSWALEL